MAMIQDSLSESHLDLIMSLTSVRLLSGPQAFRTQFRPCSTAHISTCGLILTSTLCPSPAVPEFLECLCSLMPSSFFTYDSLSLDHLLPSPSSSPSSRVLFLGVFLTPPHPGRIKHHKAMLIFCSSTCQTELCSLCPFSIRW